MIRDEGWMENNVCLRTELVQRLGSRIGVSCYMHTLEEQGNLGYDGRKKERERVGEGSVGKKKENAYRNTAIHTTKGNAKKKEILRTGGGAVQWLEESGHQTHHSISNALCMSGL